MTKDIIIEVSKELNLPIDLVDKTYKSYWRVIRDYIQSIPLKDIKTEEDFNKLRTNINVVSLGKLYTSWNKIVGLNKKYSYKKDGKI